jgi:hypothetical protein
MQDSFCTSSTIVTELLLLLSWKNTRNGLVRVIFDKVYSLSMYYQLHSDLYCHELIPRNRISYGRILTGCFRFLRLHVSQDRVVR